jgi:hypothetical protein
MSNCRILLSLLQVALQNRFTSATLIHVKTLGFYGGYMDQNNIPSADDSDDRYMYGWDNIEKDRSQLLSNWFGVYPKVLRKSPVGHHERWEYPRGCSCFCLDVRGKDSPRRYEVREGKTFELKEQKTGSRRRGIEDRRLRTGDA